MALSSPKGSGAWSIQHSHYYSGAGKMSVRRVNLLNYLYRSNAREMRGGMKDAANTPLAETGIPLGTVKKIATA